ncbi:hypothetical protein [Burkholderia latens]|uniref:hypothetical protein n=1 Tax=Burkholderia latens TaxID=488446 RepID=UPI001AE2373A|nr:hypothetical protein [Burkholderia latens]QTO47057.1 hypothetical protein J8I86_08315 [Burkholderia latens]
MNQDAINFSLFDPKKLRKAVEAIREQPRLTYTEFQKMEHEQNVLHARFEEVSKMMAPLEAAYVRARRKLGPKPYDPTTDTALQDVNKEGAERHRELLAQIEQRHAIWKKVIASAEARDYLNRLVEECGKLAEMWLVSRRILEPQFNRNSRQDDGTH